MRRTLCALLLIALMLIPCAALCEIFGDAPGNELAGDPLITTLDDQVYFIHNNSVNRMSMDGTGLTQLTNGLASDYLNALDGYLYWMCCNEGEESYGIYRMPIAGGEPEKLRDGLVYPVGVMGGFIYFGDQLDNGDERYLFRMRCDGSELIQLTDKPYDDFCLGDGMLFGFWQHYENQSLMRGIDIVSLTDGSAKALVDNKPLTLGGYSAGHVYYYMDSSDDEDAALWRIKPDGTGAEQVTGPLPEQRTDGLEGFCVSDGIVYTFEDTWRVNPFKTQTGLQGGTPAGSIYRIMPDGEKQPLYEGACNAVQVAGGWMRFNEYDDEQKKYIRRLMRADGSASVDLE